jgi:hypothetical protein
MLEAFALIFVVLAGVGGALLALVLISIELKETRQRHRNSLLSRFRETPHE